MSNYLVNEVFTSIQGEGFSVGVPSVFIRFWGCNLHCDFCDTPYAINKNSFFKKYDKNKEIKNMTQEDLIKRIMKEFETYQHVDNIVLTGGEPTLQNIQTFTEAMYKTKKVSFEIETNGVAIDKAKEQAKYYLNNTGDRYTYNVSFKLPNSSKNKPYVTEELVNEWVALKKFSKKVYFKFIYDPKYLSELETVLNYPAMQKNKHNIIIMPLGATRGDVISNGEEAWNYCMFNGYKFSPREHVILFNTKRGV